MKRFALSLAILSMFLFAAGSLLTPGRAQDTPLKLPQASPQGFPDLVKGLKSTPGCLGVETAQTSSGKQVIFAWFENKKAALAWYYSEMHQGAMKTFFPGSGSGTPMKSIQDDSKPIMAIASVTPAKKPRLGGGGQPFSQIAIELYTPAPGGIALGGRFAPPSLKVQGLRDIPVAPK
jgi:hypothetical protein